jgi:alkylation response protein AidB-like acyl-CoA dehydrogenase
MKHPIFTEKHESFRKEVREFVQKELTPFAEQWEKEKQFPKSVFTQLGQRGWLGMRYPEAYGGRNAELMFSLILSEELSRCGSFGVAGSIMAHAEVATPYIFKYGNEEIKRRYLTSAIKGEKIGGIAFTEPYAGSDVASIRTTAEKKGDKWVINGNKIFITNGTIGDFVIVLTKTSPGKGYRGQSTILVERGTPGFTSKKLSKLGNHTMDVGELTFQNCAVPAICLLGEEGKGFYQVMWNLNAERIVGTIGAIGRAQIAFDSALEYVKKREQFGQAISNFQSIQHRFADMATSLETVRQFTYYVAWLFDQGEYPVKEISMCNLNACKTAFEVADECLQMMGGYGYMMDRSMQRYWRDIRLYRITAGTEEIQREIIAGHLFPRKKAKETKSDEK